MVLEDQLHGRHWTDKIEEGTISYTEKFMKFCIEDQTEKDISQNHNKQGQSKMFEDNEKKPSLDYDFEFTASSGCFK